VEAASDKKTEQRFKLQSPLQRFIKKARELGCDEGEAAFEARLRKIAKAPAPKDAKPKVTA
jgi:hypothetical protein